ncbi:hypothetical protein ACFLSA_07160, partial [Bacteroidota bacterium]
ATPTVNVNDLPDVGLAVTNPEICLGETAGIVVSNTESDVDYSLFETIGDVFVATIEGDGNDITFNVSPGADTDYYIVGVKDVTGCTATLTNTSTITVNALPNIGLTVTDDEICLNEQATMTIQGSENGTQYEFFNKVTEVSVGTINGNGLDVDFNISPSDTTTYFVVATNSSSCFDTLTYEPTVNVNPLPATNLTVTEEAICGVGNADITVENTENQTSYSLFTTDDTPSGGPTAGPGDIVFTVNPGITTSYYILAVKTDATACQDTLQTRPEVVVSSNPDNTLSVSDTALCEGEDAEITVRNTEADVLYQLQLRTDSSNVDEPIQGGGDVVFTIPGVSSSAIYQVLATKNLDGSGCNLILTDTAIVTVTALPDETVIVSDPTTCEGNNAVIDLLNTENTIQYQLFAKSTGLDEGAPEISPGGDISITITPAVSEIYYVRATTTVGSTCEVQLQDSAIVTVNVAPFAYVDSTQIPNQTVTGDPVGLCPGDSIVFSSDTAYNYTSIRWRIIQGSGAFKNDDTTSLHTVYYPSPADYGTTVRISLNAFALSCPPSVSTFIQKINRTPIVDPGPDTTICANESYQFVDDTARYYTGLTWSGGNGFSDINSLHPLYTPTTNDLASGSVVLSLVANNGNCISGTENMTLSFVDGPEITKTTDTLILCNSDSAFISVIDTSDADSVVWTTSGDGTWNNNDSIRIDPTYIPGSQDKDNGSVTLYCASVQDSVILTILPVIEVALTSPSPFEIRSTTEISVIL